VLGWEHYLDRNGFLSCTAAPIRDPRGALAGVLDVSCEQRMHQRHSLGLVRLSVQLIEKRLFEAEFANHILVAFHERPEYVGSLQEGLVAVTPEGHLAGANSIAREWIGRRVECGGGASFAELFRQGLGKVVDRAMSSSDALIRLGLRDGTEIHVQLRSLRPRFTAFGAAGAQEAIYCLLMMKHGFAAESAHIETLDPEFEGMPILRQRHDGELKHVMSNSFGFGGTNATLILSKV